ncbi:MAG: TolC family protein [Bacteroidales bacterium]|nr:TolC family protein [Bacteroidales bacterium]
MYRRIFCIGLFALVALVMEGHPQIWTLEDCVRYAMEHNIDLRKQACTIDREGLSVQEEKWAFIPRLSASSSYTMSTGRVLDPTTYEFVKTDYTQNNSTSVSGEMSLFEGGRKIHRLERARLSLKTALLQEESLRYNLRIQIAGAYMEMLCAREQQKVAEETVSLVETQLERTRSLLSAGSVVETEVLQLQSRREAALGDALSAAYSLRMARLALCDLLEWEDDESFDIAEPAPVLPHKIIRDMESALDANPEIRSSVLGQEMAALDEKIARSAASPRLSLSAGFGTSYSDARKKMLPREDGTLKYDAYPFWEQYTDNGSAFVSLSLSIPILDGMTIKNGIRRAGIAKGEARLHVEEVRKQVRKQLIQAEMDYELARARYAHALEESAFAEEVFKQTERKYALGSADFLDWNTAVVEWAKARYSLNEAKCSVLLREEILNYYYL